MLKRAALLFVCFIVAAGGIVRANRAEPVPIRTSFDTFPMQIGAWQGSLLPPIADSVMAILRVDDYVNRVYRSPGAAGAGLYIGYYRSQRQGDSIHSPQNCLPGAGWQPASQAYLTIPVRQAAASKSISVNRMIIQKGIDRQLVLYWYQSHGQAVASEYWSKFYLVRDAVRLNRTDAALVRVIVPVSSVLDAAEATAEAQATDFVQAMYPMLSNFLPS